MKNNLILFLKERLGINIEEMELSKEDLEELEQLQIVFDDVERYEPGEDEYYVALNRQTDRFVSSYFLKKHSE